MKKRLIVFGMVLLMASLLIGCNMTAGITIDVSPNPMVFSSAADIIDATVTVTTTGIGALTIEGFSAKITGIKNNEEVDLYVFDSADVDFEPITIPFSVAGLSEEIQLSDYFTQEFGEEMTVTTLLEMIPEEFEIITYEDLQELGECTFTIHIASNNPVTEEVTIIFE
ncbi:MAG: hypothetical protein KAX49_08195 [Halanaerobiales bacterium]|nr:hypothetical protein [Halanaerobiales bacterium]